MSLDFPGAAALTGPDTASLAVTTVTFAAWVVNSGAHGFDQGTIYTKSGPAFDFADFGPFWQISVGAENVNKIALWLQGTTPLGWRLSTGTVPVGVPTHIASTYDGSFVNHYINGVLDVGSPLGPFGGSPVNRPFGPTYGRRADLPARTYNGTVEDFRIYNRALTAEEVSTIHSLKGVDGIVSGLVQRLPLRGIPGDVPAVLSDISGNSNDATPLAGVPAYDINATKVAKRRAP